MAKKHADTFVLSLQKIGEKVSSENDTNPTVFPNRSIHNMDEVKTLSEAKSHSRMVMTSSKDLTWGTPQEWFEYLDLEFDFTLDPCCHHETAKCQKHYTPAEDGLAQSWSDERVFMNPPYGRDLSKWMKKAYEEARDNCALVVCFVPARVDTEWWHRYAVKGEIRFPKGRVKFAGADASAPFPIAVIIFRPKL